MTINEARKLRAKIEEMAEGLEDEVILSYSVFCPKWESDVYYPAGARVRYGEYLYKCLMDHNSQTTWNPADAPSLWAKIINEDPSGGIPDWEQPDSTNPYMKGDKVRYDGKIYECLMDNCVWSPTDYPAAWKEVL